MELVNFSSMALPVSYEVDQSFDNDKFIKLRLRVCHDGKNVNGSYFTEKEFNDAKDSISLSPILAHVITDDEGKPHFGSHDISIEKDKMSDDDEYRIIYDEIPIGVIPEENNYVIDNYNGKKYVFVDAYVWRGYSNYAEDIIEESQDIKLSMEIKIDKYTYDAEDDTYYIEKFKYLGITLLDDSVNTGMENALATVNMFEKNDNSSLNDILNKLNSTLESYFNLKERRDLEKMDEVIKDNVVDSAMAEQIDANDNQDNDIEIIDSMSNETDEVIQNETADDTDETSTEDSTNPDNSDSDANTGSEDSNEETFDTGSNPEPEKYVRTFELSHSDIRTRLYALLDALDDDSWYWIYDVYDDYVIASDDSDGKIYKFGYTKSDNDEVFLTGTKVQVFARFLTQAEIDKLNSMQTEYDAMKVQQRKDSEDAIFNKFDMKLKEYKELKEKASDMELSAIEKECYAILGMNLVFSANEPEEDIVKVNMFNDEVKDTNDPYGGIFDEYSEE